MACPKALPALLRRAAASAHDGALEHVFRAELLLSEGVAGGRGMAAHVPECEEVGGLSLISAQRVLLGL